MLFAPAHGMFSRATMMLSFALLRFVWFWFALFCFDFALMMITGYVLLRFVLCCIVALCFADALFCLARCLVLL